MTLVYFKQGTNQIQVNTDQIPDTDQYVKVFTNQFPYNSAQIGQISCDYIMAGTVKEVYYIYERYYDETIVYVTVELNERTQS